jgi:hypothetical protein
MSSGTKKIGHPKNRSPAATRTLSRGGTTEETTHARTLSGTIPKKEHALISKSPRESDVYSREGTTRLRTTPCLWAREIFIFVFPRSKRKRGSFILSILLKSHIKFDEQGSAPGLIPTYWSRLNTLEFWRQTRDGKLMPVQRTKNFVPFSLKNSRRQPNEKGGQRPPFSHLFTALRVKHALLIVLKS